ncbi:MAG TPA: type II toxin-antitoxin system VapC family toxin [Terriglobia bacterium]|nr:type II toxin-antitoxin system VapC family toxin [Terriglobia bacterium]
MNFAYFDTSVVVKRYVLEPGSLPVRGLLRQHDFLSSAITPLEILSALGRREQSGELSRKNFAAAIRRVRSDRARWELIELGAVVLNRAEEIIQQRPMRALDAIHIASVLVFQASAGLHVPFVTADSKQRGAAEQMSLRVIWIG